ncbi:sigma-54-dependent Fis family transcriptional regulator [Priestia filamentosa]|uniref:Sigma-54-dependent Fis family transcriptional regulator n=2 Tax=Priestia filamentosa TaxID=1402861 RepID=A0A1X7EPX8_9BACI|nr:sigma-54-dependent Fis family transcriptional regulator [Priestia filamentosa]AKO93193.1 sigma-54-dependent Fis family transcriptional regulator [Priestia filamentosa]MDT3763333.1 sigma-54-dependent Fis family transcriptional regulator [Priestia filamentosa]OXS69893.1 sigma-54-dependent Fis family transcriptional regulator [Priestia filamentosa]RJS63520.1 sigma-54-dependent Fis family transcriptional regulator [Priestia filamentosa]WRU93794.1 sigma-54-dependent Fis family transcriptional re
MVFSLPSVKELIMNVSFDRSHIERKNGEFYYRSTAKTDELLCKTVDENESLSTLIEAFSHHSAVVILDSNKKPVGCITASRMIRFLYNYYNQLKAFYKTIIQTSDASVTVIDANENVCTWTEGAEKIFSVTRQDIMGQPITDFFDYKKLEILQSLYKGKSIVGHYHQPRSDLFVLINSNPVYLEGEIIGAVVSETDVTNQVALNEKLFNMSNEVHRLEQEVAKYKDSSDPFHSIKGKSSALQRTVNLARKVCSVKSTVLILGESGVGKEVFAKAIHEASEEPNAPFISINCGAIPASLFESELFGYERGAFSGANSKGKKGKIELAKGGTLFLDEIGEMPLEMQVKLLRVFQERRYYRVGGEKEIDINFRLIAATNRDLHELMKEGKFREDLYYRLNVVSLHIPPLRERKEDIIELTHYFLNDFSLSYQRPIHEFPPEVIQEMLRYDWPGNIRELRNIVERLIVFATDGVIKREYLPFNTSNISFESTLKNASSVIIENDSTILPLQEEMNQYEKKIIERALQILNGNKVECAKQLGITRATLYNRLKRLGIN